MYRESDPGFDLGYVRSRLEGTVVHYPKGKDLVLVRRVSNRDDGSVYAVIHHDWERSDKIKEERVDFRDLDLTTPRLGNVNFDGTCLFVSRRPLRNDWKQGLRFENLSFRSSDRAKNRFGRCHLSELKQPVYQTYPTIHKALDMVEEIFADVAISRHFSVGEDMTLNYKAGKRVGKINLDNGRVKLDTGYEWLRELAQEEARVDFSI